jgi:N-acyl homoserine lactone hydrolase
MQNYIKSEGIHMNWNIKVLHFGTITVPKTISTPGLDEGVNISAPYLGFLLQKQGTNVLVDTGINERYIVDGKSRWGNYPASGGTSYVVKALEKEGLKPSDIDMVLYTHLHNDHTGACHLFPDAETIFQKDEWANLLSPLPNQVFRNDYDLTVIDIFRKMKNVVMVDGDVELANGLKLYKTPGHTKGSMSILVPTGNGPRIILGDLFYFPFYMFPQINEMIGMDGSKIKISPLPESMGPILVHAMIYDHYEYYDSFYKVRALAPRFEEKYFVYGHDGSLLHTGVR